MEGNGLLFIFHNIVNNLDNNLDNNSIATDDNFINQLNKITAEDKHESLTCSICLENFKKGEKIIQLPCNHFFHTDFVFFIFVGLRKYKNSGALSRRPLQIERPVVMWLGFCKLAQVSYLCNWLCRGVEWVFSWGAV